VYHPVPSDPQRIKYDDAQLTALLDRTHADEEPDENSALHEYFGAFKVAQFSADAMLDGDSVPGVWMVH
jgi:hypothetical protein